jgi:hypothetical protein
VRITPYMLVGSTSDLVELIRGGIVRARDFLLGDRGERANLGALPRRPVSFIAPRMVVKSGMSA